MSEFLFPKLPKMIHGGDYNPDHWLDHPEVLAEDIEVMKKAGINCVTLGVFAWASYEPREGEYHFEWLKERMDTLYENGIYTILATPTGARPAWLDAKYPECMRVWKDGRRAHHGFRHNHCMSSPVFREKSEGIIRKLIEAVGNHPGLILWHINNELGGDCYCEHCVKKFRTYLSDKFDGDIKKLNDAWWAGFWSHTFNDFDQIEPPYDNGEFSVMGLNLEWNRFNTYSMNDYVAHEIRILRELTPDIPITTNFMQLFAGLDYRKMAPMLDVISWDSYPEFHNDYESFEDTMRHSAFDHAFMRSLKKDKPFMLMESAPGYVNWHHVNKRKRPYTHKLFSLQTVGCGSDTVQYFQIRQGRGAYEQFHGAVIEHMGTEHSRAFKEVAEVGNELTKLTEVCGSLVKSKAALIYDLDTRWAIDDVLAMCKDTKNYPKVCLDIFAEFTKLGIDMDVISQEDDFSDYKVIIAPMMYVLHKGTADKLKDFVNKGGQLLATYTTGYVDENTLCFLGGFPGDGLADLFGIYADELDTFYPSDENHVIFNDGSKALVKDYAEMLRLNGAISYGTYESDYYEGTPAVTINEYGQGKAYYVAARIDMKSMAKLFRMMLEDAGVAIPSLPVGVELHTRENDIHKYSFYLNMTADNKTIDNISGYDLLTDNDITCSLDMKPYSVAVIRTVK